MMPASSNKTDLVIESIIEKYVIRFWSKIVILEKDNCWEWTAGKGSNGHGVFSVANTLCYAHRIAYFLANGTLPALVMHDCENPLCCNPKHLLEGTPKLNSNYPGRLAKISTIHKGKKLTTETKAKLRLAHLGKKHTKETKAKMRVMNLGKTHSAETKAKIRAMLLGRSFSAETKARMSLAQIKRYHKDCTNTQT